MSNEQYFQHLSNDPNESVIPVVDNGPANSLEPDDGIDSEPSQSADPMNQNEATQVKAGEVAGDSATNSTQSNNRRKWIIGGSAAALVLTTGIGIGANIARGQADAQPQGNDQSTNELFQQPIDQSGINPEANTATIVAPQTETKQINDSKATESTEVSSSSQEVAPEVSWSLDQDMIDGLMGGEGYTNEMIGELNNNMNKLAQYPDIIEAMKSDNPRTMLSAFCLAFQNGFKNNDPSLPTYLVLPGTKNPSIADWAPSFLQGAIDNKNNPDPENRIDSILCRIPKAQDIQHAITFESGNEVTEKLVASPDQAYFDQYHNAYVGATGLIASISNNGTKVHTVAEDYDVVYYIETLNFTGSDGSKATFGFLQNGTVNPANLPSANN